MRAVNLTARFLLTVDEYSLVEKAILQGLGVDHLDFQPTRPRCAFGAEEIARHRELGREG